MTAPSKWLPYLKSLDKLMLSIPCPPGVGIWRASLPTEAGPKELRAIFDKAEAKHSVEIARAIDAVTERRLFRWKDVSGQTATLVRLRIETVCNYVTGLFLGKQDGFTSKISFPAVNYSELTRWFLTVWWQYYGKDLALTELIYAHWCEQHEQDEDDGCV